MIQMTCNNCGENIGKHACYYKEPDWLGDCDFHFCKDCAGEIFFNVKKEAKT